MGGPIELSDQPPSPLHSPPRIHRSHFGRGFRGRRCGATVQPLRFAPRPERRVAKGLQALQVAGGLELPSERPLAEIVPLRQEPRAVVEARDFLPAQLVHQGFEGRRVRPKWR